MEKEPTLFTIEGEIQEQDDTLLTPEEWAEFFAFADDLRATAKKAGVYVVIPPNSLLQRVETWFKSYESIIKTALKESGLPEDLQRLVFNDYVAVFCGTNINATPQQADIILNHITTVQAFNVDRLAFFYALLLNYTHLTNSYAEWVNTMRNETSTVEDKVKYLEILPQVLCNSDWLAFSYMVANKLITPNDFTGIDSGLTLRFFDTVEVWAGIASYAYYYFVAKYCLLATPEELESITPPPTFDETQTITAVEYAEAFCDRANKLILDFSKAVSKVIVSETPEQREKAIQQVEAKKQEIQGNVPSYQNLTTIMSMPVNIAPNETELFKAINIKELIRRKLQEPEFEKYGDITPYDVQKVFEGINLLPYYLTEQHSYNEQKTYSFGISQFAEICGLGDANQTEKLSLLGGLQILNNMYVIINRPYRVGKDKKKRGGPVALRVISIQELGLKTGEIVLDIAPEAFKGKPTLLTPQEFETIREETKGLSRSRFINQLKSKAHKEENALLDEVFGYTELLNEAEKTGGTEEIKNTKAYIRKHKSIDRKKIISWFEDLKEKAIISYNRTENKKGETVYSWRWLNHKDNEQIDEQ